RPLERVPPADAPVRIPGGRVDDAGLGGPPDAVHRWPLEGAGRLVQQLRIVAGVRSVSARGAGAQQSGALEELAPDVAAHRHLALQLGDPAPVEVRPGLDGEAPPARRTEGDVRGPAVVSQRVHGTGAPRAGVALGRDLPPP